MYSFMDFLHGLEGACWQPAGYIDAAVLELLKELDGERELLHQEVLSWATGNLEYRGLTSHETATHYKWFVYYDETLAFRVWLHQYKSSGDRVLGHAEVPHNHRYSLASLVISGGFDHHVFGRGRPSFKELDEPGSPLRVGDTYALQWDEVHKLSALLDRTLTLVIESPIVRHYSEAFYAGADRPRRFYDFAGLHSSLCEATQSALADPPAAGRRISGYGPAECPAVPARRTA